jgi:N-acetylneuraminic acid mutarotase
MKLLSKITILLSALMMSCMQLKAELWQVKKDMPTARQEIYAASSNSIIYIPGGILTDIVTTTSAFEAFDVKLNNWQQLASLPAPRHHITPVIINEKLYAMGGFEGPYPKWVMKSDLFVYDIGSDTWTKGQSLPEARGEHVSAVVDNRIHVIGGRVRQGAGDDHFDSYFDSDTHRVYDSSAHKWSAAASAPTARNSAAAVVIDGLIYVVGGRQNVIQENGSQLQQNVAALEVYDPLKDSWQVLTPMPEATGGSAAAASDGKLYVFGGEQWAPKHKVFSNTWVYNPKTDNWTRGPDMPTARHGLAAATVGGAIYTIGGCTKVGGGAAVGTTETIQP